MSAKPKLLEPIHPGEILLEEFMKPLGISINRLSRDIVEILKPISLLELVGAELYLSEVVGLKVDLVPKRSLRAELKEAILKEAVAV